MLTNKKHRRDQQRHLEAISKKSGSWKPSHVASGCRCCRSGCGPLSEVTQRQHVASNLLRRLSRPAWRRRRSTFIRCRVRNHSLISVKVNMIPVFPSIINFSEKRKVNTTSNNTFPDRPCSRDTLPAYPSRYRCRWTTCRLSLRPVSTESPQTESTPGRGEFNRFLSKASKIR